MTESPEPNDQLAALRSSYRAGGLRDRGRLGPLAGARELRAAYRATGRLTSRRRPRLTRVYLVARRLRRELEQAEQSALRESRQPVAKRDAAKINPLAEVMNASGGAKPIQIRIDELQRQIGAWTAEAKSYSIYSDSAIRLKAEVQEAQRQLKLLRIAEVAPDSDLY